MFMVEYEPGGVAQPHDHPFEETYYMLEGEVDAMADGQTFTLHAGDIFWTGVGCIHAFYNTSGGRVRFLETQSPQPPTNYSYRFNRDWEYLAERLS
jgi:quercetin dioxygenase-like cupin family protein